MREHVSLARFVADGDKAFSHQPKLNLEKIQHCADLRPGKLATSSPSVPSHCRLPPPPCSSTAMSQPPPSNDFHHHCRPPQAIHTHHRHRPPTPSLCPSTIHPPPIAPKTKTGAPHHEQQREGHLQEGEGGKVEGNGASGKKGRPTKRRMQPAYDRNVTRRWRAFPLVDKVCTPPTHRPLTTQPPQLSGIPV